MLNLKRNKREKEQFEEQLLENMNSLYNLAYRLSGHREEAGDLVQEASMRAYRFYHKYEYGTNFKAWILTILRNIFINKYRKRVKEPPQFSYDALENGPENLTSIQHTTGVEEEIFGESVQKSINKLPEELKSVVILFYVEGLAYKEIAEVMDCPIGTVMSRLHMARRLLKKQLTELMRKEELT